MVNLIRFTVKRKFVFAAYTLFKAIMMNTATEKSFVATQEVTISQKREVVWNLLTEPYEISNWFADAEPAEKSGFVNYSFGDGDFFETRTVISQAPVYLEWEWSFMGLGPSYQIKFSLSENGEKTVVKVKDFGSITENEAKSLTEGWMDFFERLKSYAESGENSRYLWSQEISLSAWLPEQSKDQTISSIFPVQNWQNEFPDAEITQMESDASRSVWRLKEKDWKAETQVTASLRNVRSKNYLTIYHDGWEDILELPLNVAQRRRYAGTWRRILVNQGGE